jgi:hypothetical protein
MHGLNWHIQNPAGSLPATLRLKGHGILPLFYSDFTVVKENHDKSRFKFGMFRFYQFQILARGFGRYLHTKS